MNGYLIYDFDLELLKELNPGLTENEIISMGLVNAPPVPKACQPAVEGLVYLGCFRGVTRRQEEIIAMILDFSVPFWVIFFCTL